MNLPTGKHVTYHISFNIYIKQLLAKYNIIPIYSYNDVKRGTCNTEDRIFFNDSKILKLDSLYS